MGFVLRWRTETEIDLENNKESRPKTKPTCSGK
jgi:hypothetical protein